MQTHADPRNLAGFSPHEEMESLVPRPGKLYPKFHNPFK